MLRTLVVLSVLCAVPALAQGAVIGVGSLLAKGMVEDLFEKHRLATLAGLLVGVMVVAGREVLEGVDTDQDVVPVETEQAVVVPPSEVKVPAWS